MRTKHKPEVGLTFRGDGSYQVHAEIEGENESQGLAVLWHVLDVLLRLQGKFGRTHGVVAALVRKHAASSRRDLSGHWEGL